MARYRDARSLGDDREEAPTRRELARRGVPPDIAAQDISSPRVEVEYPRVVQVPPPELVPPPGSLDVIRLVSATTVGANDTQALFTYDVPNGIVLIVRAIDTFINDMVAATNINFDLLYRGAPLQGWTSIGIFPRVAASVATTFDQTVIRVIGPGTFSARSNNIDGGNHLVGAGFQGYQMTVQTYLQFGGKIA